MQVPTHSFIPPMYTGKQRCKQFVNAKEIILKTKLLMLCVDLLSCINLVLAVVLSICCFSFRKSLNVNQIKSEQLKINKQHTLAM